MSTQIGLSLFVDLQTEIVQRSLLSQAQLFKANGEWPAMSSGRTSHIRASTGQETDHHPISSSTKAGHNGPEPSAVSNRVSLLRPALPCITVPDSTSASSRTGQHRQGRRSREAQQKVFHILVIK